MYSIRWHVGASHCLISTALKAPKMLKTLNNDLECYSIHYRNASNILYLELQSTGDLKLLIE